MVEAIPGLILLGTDADAPGGGVGVALRGFEAAAEAAGIPCRRLTTHRAGGVTGKLIPWARVHRTLSGAVEEMSDGGIAPVVYAHAGAWPSLVRKAALLSIARGAGARTLVHLHGVELDEYLERPTSRRLIRMLATGSVRLVVPSQWWRDRVEGALPGARVAVLPNPLSPEVMEAAAAPRQGREADGLHVVSLARLVRGKGVGVTIDAVAGLGPGVRLTVAGEGPRRRALQVRARAAGLGARVAFPGWVAGEPKWDLLRSTDVFCLPGTNDAFPMGVAEAMALGLPVVAGRQRAIPDLVLDGETGILVEPTDVEDVSAALTALGDGPFRARLGQAARIRAREQFSPEAVGARLARLLREI